MQEVNIVLANRKGLGAVRLCGCNTIHLSIGPITLALAPEAFAQAATLMQEAAEQLQKIVETKNAKPADALDQESQLNRWTHSIQPR
jgi:hypothetical protein